jgi:hypothetical protein
MSEFHLNNPDFDPSKLRAMEHKFKNGMQREEHERTVAAGLKMLGVGEDQATDIDKTIAIGTMKIRKVIQQMESIDAEIRNAGRSHDHNAFYVQTVQFLWQEFEDFSKEDLLIILTMFLAKAIKKDIV